MVDKLSSSLVGTGERGGEKGCGGGGGYTITLIHMIGAAKEATQDRF
jgi:hypothetical protein